MLREITEQLDCGLVLAIHEKYLDRPDYQEFTTGRIVERRVPALTEEAQLAQIIDRRASFLEPATAYADLLSAEALTELLAVHRLGREGGLRHTLGILHQALSLAISEAGAQLVEARHVRAAHAGV